MGTLALGIDDCLLRVARAGVDVTSSPESRLRADEVEVEAEFITKEEGTFLAGGLSAIGWVQVSAGICFLQVAFASGSYHHYPDLRLWQDLCIEFAKSLSLDSRRRAMVHFDGKAWLSNALTLQVRPCVCYPVSSNIQSSTSNTICVLTPWSERVSVFRSGRSNGLVATR